MRLHTDTLTYQDIYDACRKARVSAPVLSRHGSRKRDHAFEVILSGSNPRNANGNDFKAATWDEWGVFLAHLFYRDPQMFAGTKNWNYDGAEHFNRRTDDRFVWRPDTFNYMPSDTHPQHKWTGAFDGALMFCTKCSARWRYR